MSAWFILFLCAGFGAVGCLVGFVIGSVFGSCANRSHCEERWYRND